MRYEWVADNAALAAACAACRAGDAVAVDTEFMRQSTFFPRPALLQLCDGATVWLIDPLAISDPAPVSSLFSDPAVTKVLHAASEDLEVFARWPGVLPQPLFDTQRAAALLGLGQGLGYRALVAALCAEELEKGETRSDWLHRPLSEAQCHYAAQDVWYLLTMYRKLCVALEALGRLEWVREDSAQALANATGLPPPYYTRIKGASRLDRRGLAVLRSLADWRERTARAEDRPRNWVVDDAACLALARVRPADPADLEALAELPSSTRRRYGETLLAIIAKSSATPDDALPPLLPGPLSPAERLQLKRLKRALGARAAELAVEPEALLSTRDLELLLRGAPAGEPAGWQGWRAKAVLPGLRAALAQPT